MYVVVLIALASAALFALGSSLQHRSAGNAPSTSKRAMAAALLRRPSWVIGALLCASAFGLHALALSRGDLTVVQPIILSGIVFAVFARSAIDRRLPSRGELGWAGVTWAGLALFIAALKPVDPRPPQNDLALIVVGVGLAVVAVLGLAARKVNDQALRRGVLLAAGAGLCFGLVAGLVKLTTTEAGNGLLSALGAWSTWVLVGVGATAILLNQRAYQSTRLSVTAPVLNIVQLLISLSFGLIVFRERLFASPATVVFEVAGLAVMMLGVVRLATRAAEDPGTEPERSGGRAASEPTTAAPRASAPGAGAPTAGAPGAGASAPGRDASSAAD